jgi:thiol:disulfide interchange protein
MPMCCAIGALLLAAIAVWRRGINAARDWRPHLRWAAVSAAAAVIMIAGAALAAQHVDHYAARAQASGRSVLAEMIAQPICRGGSSRLRENANVSPLPTGLD